MSVCRAQCYTDIRIMMSSCVLYAVCVILCAVHSVHSYTIRGAITHLGGEKSAVKVTNNLNGDNWASTWTIELTLDKLEDTTSLPTLTVSNFSHIERLFFTNISLEQVPVFINTYAKYVHLTGNKIRNVSTDAFSELQPSTLDLNNNEIHHMANESVNGRARSVFLRCNNLSYFSQSWFSSPGSVVLLALENNRIEYIADRAFSQMTGLRDLALSYNRITSIGSAAFGPRISGLSLEFNNIVQLPSDMFADHQVSIVSLNLHHNQLSFLPETLLLTVKPQTISLFGNPWQCQCLRHIERWLRQVNSTRLDIPARRGEPVCVVPVNFQTACIPIVDKELQQTYANGLSPVPECWMTDCFQCALTNFTRLT